MPENRLSASIEARYRLTWLLFSFGVPLTIAGVGVFASLARVGVWIGSEDEIGRALLVATSVCALAARFSKRARTLLIFLVIAAFGGRAFGFLILGAPDMSWPNRIGATGIWACITALCLGMLLQLDTLIAFRDERRVAGIE